MQEDGRMCTDKMILQNWISYQKLHFKRKLQMANSYPCNMFYSSVTAFNAALSIISGQCLEVRHGLICLTITLDKLRGFNPENGNIRLILAPDEEPPVILQFANADIQAVVLTELKDFARDNFHGTTPPSSTDSDD